MKGRLKAFGIMGLFWIGFFFCSRVIFLLYHADQTFSLTTVDIITIFFLGVRMDLAMSAYWIILTGLLLTIPFIRFKAIYVTQNVLTALFLLISITIIVVDLELYSHWGFRMNLTPLFYISKEAAGSVNPFRLVVLMILFGSMSAVSYWLYLKYIAKKFLALPQIPLRWSPVMLLITGCLFIPIRSSFSVAPLNTGAVYFHKTKSFPNHAGINVVWNFFNSLTAKDKLKYPSNFYQGDPSPVLAQMEVSTAPSSGLLNRSRPNIILVIVESFTSNIIAPLGGLPDITPNLNALVHDGVLFDHVYASGDRTDKGLLAVLSGYPAQPRTSIIRFPQKTEQLPFLSRDLSKLGYHPSFLYGGDIAFANMKSYLTTAGFSHITEGDDFDSKLDNSKWGVADHFVFDRLLTESDSASHPFFKVMLTLSSHEPFEVPMEPVLQGKDERSLFLNACIYTDKSIGEFIKQAREKSWWKNTLIVITADHGHRFPNAVELKEKERFKIPMLWLGGALTKQDTVIHTIGGQTDIANTLLAQLDVAHDSFKFSKNLLDQHVNSFAVYVFQNGFGYVDPENEYVYDFDFSSLTKKSADESSLNKGRAYMQALFNDYNSR